MTSTIFVLNYERWKKILTLYKINRRQLVSKVTSRPIESLKDSLDQFAEANQKYPVFFPRGKIYILLDIFLKRFTA